MKSSIPPSQGGGGGATTTTAQQPPRSTAKTDDFAQRVYDMVEECQKSRPDICSWVETEEERRIAGVESGSVVFSGFLVRNAQALVQGYFKKYEFVNRNTEEPTTFVSFHRQLNNHGFSVRSPDGRVKVVRHGKGLFLRGRVDLLSYIEKSYKTGGTCPSASASASRTATATATATAAPLATGASTFPPPPATEVTARSLQLTLLGLQSAMYSQTNRILRELGVDESQLSRDPLLPPPPPAAAQPPEDAVMGGYYSSSAAPAASSTMRATTSPQPPPLRTLCYPPQTVQQAQQQHPQLASPPRQQQQQHALPLYTPPPQQFPQEHFRMDDYDCSSMSTSLQDFPLQGPRGQTQMPNILDDLLVEYEGIFDSEEHIMRDDDDSLDKLGSFSRKRRGDDPGTTTSAAGGPRTSKDLPPTKKTFCMSSHAVTTMDNRDVWKPRWRNRKQQQQQQQQDGRRAKMEAAQHGMEQHHRQGQLPSTTPPPPPPPPQSKTSSRWATPFEVMVLALLVILILLQTTDIVLYTSTYTLKDNTDSTSVPLRSPYPTTEPTATPSGKNTVPPVLPVLPVLTSTNESPLSETELPRILQYSFSPYLTSYQDALFWNTSSPQQCALDWMLHQDEYLRVNLSRVEDPLLRSRKMAERYAMAVLFFQTQAAECDGSHPVDREFSGSQQMDRQFSSWEFAGQGMVFMEPLLDVCEWYSASRSLGIRCHEQNPYVGSLNLASIALDGSLPDEIVVLRSIESLFFSGAKNVTDSKLHGSLPTVLAQMPQLSDLYVRFHSLTGTIPSNLFGELTVPLRLKIFNVMSNLLSGPLPEVAVENGLEQLRHVQLSKNSISPRSGLTGTIPDSWQNLVNLQTLDLSTNRLTGTIPSGLVRLEELDSLDLSHNFLEGSIPPSRWGSQFHYINLSYNDLVGELPVSWRSSLRLMEIDVSFNPRLLNGTGTLPSELSDLGLLRRLNLQGIEELKVLSLDFMCEQAEGDLKIAVSCLDSQNSGSNSLCKCCCCACFG